jgi:glycosyltransferase involved in cell wall biosynthesis
MTTKFLDFATDTDLVVVHYCCACYPNFGGVARFDYHVSLAFPSRKWFQGPRQKNEMLKFVKNETEEKGKKVVVITDNHLACDIPNDYFVILVHHGVVKNTIGRTPGLDRDPMYQRILDGQTKMFKVRDASKTLILSCSQDCIDSFAENEGSDYLKFKIKLLLHTSELSYGGDGELSPLFQKVENEKPKVLGNWSGLKKGEREIGAVKKILKDEFVFVDLKTSPTSSVETHNKEVEKIYRASDIFLQLSSSEGNSYATLDAFSQNLLVVGTNVGLLYDLDKEGADVDPNVALVFHWKKMNDCEFVAEKIREIWKNRKQYSGNSRRWFEKNCDFENWITNFKEIVISSVE